jgi:hypothetical protein
VYDNRDRLLFGANTFNSGLKTEDTGIHHLQCCFDDNVLVPGEYFISIGCYDRIKNRNIHFVNRCLILVVINIPFIHNEVFSIGASTIFSMRSSWQIM